MAPPSTSGRQNPGPAKKKPRRSSSRGDASAPSNYGPVACTSGNAALVQAYLTVDVPQQRQLHADSADNESAVPRLATTLTGESVLHIAESRFDSVKRRFGGKSKPVSLAADGCGGSGRGPRLTFGPSAKIVATREAMHAVLHCRCVFVLLHESAESDASTSNGSSSNDNSNHNGNNASTATASSEKQGPDTAPDRDSSHSTGPAETAHLVTLSPDDLFSALSVDSFSLTSYSEADGACCGRDGRGRGTESSERRSKRRMLAAGAGPRAFEVLDGPIVVHRPAAWPGEHWRGLEVFRAAAAGEEGDDLPRRWCGQRIVAPWGVVQAVDAIAEGEGRGRNGDVIGSASAGGESEVVNGCQFSLDLPKSRIANGENSIHGETEHSNKPASKSDSLLVCPPRECCSVHEESLFSRTQSMRHNRAPAIDHAAAAVVSLPAGPAPKTTAGAIDAMGAKQPVLARSTTAWASLCVDKEGRASLVPWHGHPCTWRSSFTCMCRAPATDSGIVGLADATPGAEAGGGLVLRPLPPTVYVGATDERKASGARIGTGGSGAGGSLLELQGGGALSCARSLPAPPLSITVAAVDDGKGILAVLLADPAGTALLLARDGSNFPVVEEYRGVAALFTGDFLGNGREQVALLAAVSPVPMTGAAAAALSKVGAAEWEQLPLKALAKRALVTDCSCVWGNGQRDDLAALPGNGPIYVAGVSPSGVSGGGVAVASGSQRLAGGRKRPREEPVVAVSGESGEVASSTTGGAANSGSTRKAVVDDDHRLGRLSTVVGVLRRRVHAEEARLLRLRQARRGKAALLEAAKLTLTTHVSGSIGGFSVDGLPGMLNSAVKTFSEGLVSCFPEAATSTPTPRPAHTTSNYHAYRRPLRCVVERVRFHAPSRTLCLDAFVSNLPDIPMDDELSGTAVGSDVVANVCLSVACSSGSLSTRSAVCPRLAPGQSAVIRASVEVPAGLLASGGGSPTGAASLFASCSWCWDWSSPADGPSKGKSSKAAKTDDRDFDNGRPLNFSSMFSRILVSPQDVLGVGVLGSVAGEPFAPVPRAHSRQPTISRPGEAGKTELKGVGSPAMPNGLADGRVVDANDNAFAHHHLGLFDVGTPLNVLVRSHTASLAALPQAVRALSSLAALPEPWAGGALAYVGGCSERAAECTLRASDSVGAATVLLQVAAGALPDGVKASVNYASEEGRALIATAAQALQEEMAVVETVATEQRRGGGGDVTNGGREGLRRALNQYTQAQMRTDVIASRLTGLLLAAAAGDGGNR